MSTELRNFLALPYDELEELNLKAKKQRLIVLRRKKCRKSASSI